MSIKKRRLAVIDDDESIRTMLEMALELEGFEVRAAGDGAAGLDLIREWQPECVVLDVMMPKIDGITLLPMIRRMTDAPIVMLTARGDTQDRIEGLRSGADDYLPKPFDLQELATRLHAALRRGRLREIQCLTYGDLEIDLEAHVVRRSGEVIQVSKRAFDLLQALARRPNRVFTRDELINLVWGDDSETSTQTVESCVSFLRSKIDAPPHKAIIHTVRGVGYVLR